MTVANGEFANEDTFNDAFVSKDTDSTVQAFLTLAEALRLQEFTNSTLTGSAATLPRPDTSVVRVTNGGLTGIQNIDTPSRGYILLLINDTGNELEILNDTGGTASLRIYTGTGATLPIPPQGMAFMYYDIVAARWRVLGGSGSGSGSGLSEWVTGEDYIADAVNPSVVIESNKIYKCIISHTSGTFATDLAANRWVEISATPVIDLNSSDVTGVLPVANGGTGSSTRNFVDLTSSESIAGDKTFTDTLISSTILSVEGILKLDIFNDATTTGTGAQINITNKPVIKLTNNSLVSVAMIENSQNGESIKIINGTDSPIKFLNESGATATYRIDTALGFDMLLEVGGMVEFLYDNLSSRWRVVGKPQDSEYLLEKSTGLKSGGALSIGTPTSTFSIADGVGRVIDNTSTPNVLTRVSWTGLTNLTITNLATHPATYVAINSAGAVVQQTTPFTNTQARENIILGIVGHRNNTSVTGILNQPEVVHAPVNQLRELEEGLGIFNVSGNVFSANGANLSLNKSLGYIHKSGSNFATDPKNPNTKELGALTALTFQYRLQNGTAYGDVTSVDPDNYDLAGVLTAVPNNKFTIQRIFIFTNNAVRIQYGQAVYDNMFEAQAGVAYESFTVEDVARENGLLRGYLIIKEGATSLQNASQAMFIEAAKFGSAGGGSIVTKFCPPVHPQWYKGDTNSPFTDFTSGFHIDNFDNLSSQEIYALVDVPDEYVAGSRILLRGLQFFSSTTTGNVLFKTQATLLKSTYVFGALANQRTSTNSQVAISGVANTFTSVGDLDLTDTVGAINSVAVAPADKILIRLYRDNASETSALAADARVIRDGIVTFTS